MSCIDSKTPKKRKNLQSENMGDVIGKEPDKTEIEEMSLEFTDSRPEREDADGAPSPEEPNMQNGDVINDSDEVELYEGCDKDETPCDCDACKDRRIAAAENLKEIRQLQAYWMELRQYIRMVYRMAMDGKCPTESFQAYIKDLVSKLCLCDPHQLFQRLESQVREFVIEAKVHQIELLHTDKDSPDLPKLFISGLLDSYKKLMTAAVQLVPLLEQLQNEHLIKFNLTWKVLNQHLYQSCVYTDPLVQNNVPTYISMLSNTSNEDAEANKKLVRDFLSFDDEITLVGGMWSDVETRIHRYNQEQATLKAKQKMLKEDWELFKATRKLIQQQKDWQSEISFGEAQQFDEHTWKVGDDSSCSHRTCPCDECAMNHLISCGGLVPLSPTVPYSSHKAETGVRVEGEGREKVEASNDCECHVCTAPPETRPIDWESETVNLNLHLYPHIHGKDVSNGDNGLYHHLYNVYPSQSQNNPNDSPEDLEDPDIPILEKLRQNFIKKICEEVSNECPDLDDDEDDDDDDEEEEEEDDDEEDEDDDDDEFRPTSPIGPPPPGPNSVTVINANGIKQEVDLHEKLHKHSTTQTHAHQHPRLHQTLPDTVKSIPPPCHKHPEPIKRVMCPDHADEEEDTTPEDSCSERSSCSTQRDSRHCDCCYCEVFGHGVPSVAPVSRNYQEMRERLRLLLTKKKAKCKSATVPGNNTSGNTGPPNNHPNGNSSGINSTSTSNISKSKDTRDLEDLLHFIEGNPNSKCKDEKKAAKKARQKQKKQEEIDRKKREEEEAAERRRLEEEAAAAALLKQQQKAQAKKKKKKNKVANNVNNNTNNNNNNTKSTKLNEQVPQMVTIKRVMEPNSAEPTVTITLRGATPNEDKVLYTLLNGQVCQVEKDSKNSKKQQGPAGNSKNKVNVNNGNSVVITNQNRFVNGQNGKNNKTTKKEVVNIKTTVNNQLKKNENLKPKPITPQLTNPTAIQINNAINRLSSRPPVPNFSLDNLKLPPGITITKVDPAQVSQRKPIQIKPSAPPPAPTPPPSVPASSNVIVVNTGRLKDLNTISDRGQSDDGSNGKKKKKKKGNGNENITTNNNNNIVTLSMNGGPKNLMTPPPLQNGKVMMSSQAAIIKVNGSMVTIRNPVLQQSMNVESETASDQSKKKKKKKKKGTNGKGQQDECVDSVFAPKDIDLENGDIDEGERELEAFKRFCLQSVPLKRKEKVHLNIKDIVLKKKSSAISCS